MDTIKLAVFGLNQGLKIARDAVKNPEVELVAVAGFGEQAEAAAQEVGAPLYGDYTELLAKVPLDAVAIALPNGLHVKAVEDSLAAGLKYILLEKPIANTAEEGQRIVDACHDAGATLLIGHHRRSSNNYRFLREFLDSGRLGDIVGYQCNYALAKARNYYNNEWHTKRGGGPLLVNAIHDIDDLNFISDSKVNRVYAAVRNTIRGNEAEDSASVLFELEGGATATYFLSDGVPGPWSYDLAACENIFLTMCPGENSLRIFGTKGSFGFPNMDFYYYDEGHYGWNEELHHEHFEVERNDPMAAELAHFVDLVKGRETAPRCTGEDGLEAVKIINAIQESSDSRLPVDID